MHANAILALGGLLGAVAAVPFAEQHYHHHEHHRRELVWETVTEEVVQTIPVTKTVWLEPGETPPTAAVKPAQSSAPHAPAYTPESSPVAPVYSAPAPSSPASSPAPPAYTPPAYTPPVESSPASSPAPPAYTPPVASSPASSPAPPAYTPPASTYVAPVPTSTYVPPPAPVTPSSSYVAPAPPSSSSSAPTGGSAGGYSTGMAAHGTKYTGEMTWYDPSIGYNACGTICGADEHVVAVSHVIWESYGSANTNMSPLCNATVTITGTDGSPYNARVVDKCPGCTENNLDLTNALFTLVTGESDGRIPGVTWQFD